MSFFTNFRADRLITEIKTSSEPLGAATLKAVAKLKELGPGAIEPTVQALADADKNATVALVDVLDGRHQKIGFNMMIADGMNITRLTTLTATESWCS